MAMANPPDAEPAYVTAFLERRELPDYEESCNIKKKQLRKLFKRIGTLWQVLFALEQDRRHTVARRLILPTCKKIRKSIKHKKIKKVSYARQRAFLAVTASMIINAKCIHRTSAECPVASQLDVLRRHLKYLIRVAPSADDGTEPPPDLTPSTSHTSVHGSSSTATVISSDSDVRSTSDSSSDSDVSLGQQTFSRTSWARQGIRSRGRHSSAPGARGNPRGTPGRGRSVPDHDRTPSTVNASWGSPSDYEWPSPPSTPSTLYRRSRTDTMDGTPSYYAPSAIHWTPPSTGSPPPPYRSRSQSPAPSRHSRSVSASPAPSWHTTHERSPVDSWYTPRDTSTPHRAVHPQFSRSRQDESLRPVRLFSPSPVATPHGLTLPGTPRPTRLPLRYPSPSLSQSLLQPRTPSTPSFRLAPLPAPELTPNRIYGLADFPNPGFYAAYVSDSCRPGTRVMLCSDSYLPLEWGDKGTVTRRQENQYDRRVTLYVTWDHTGDTDVIDPVHLQIIR